MYCNTRMTGITCVINELLLWTHISGDHPVFLKTVAELSKKQLPTTVVDRLMQISKTFKAMQQSTAMLKKSLQTGTMKPATAFGQTTMLIDRFLKNNEYVLTFYPELKKYGPDDQVWQTLLEHILDEQQFMQELMTDLRRQMAG